MNKTNLVLATFITLTSTAVMAQEDISYSVSLKDWNNKFIDIKSKNTNSTIISATARKGDYFLTGSTMLSSTYYFGGTTVPTFIRDDRDIAIGYQFAPSFSVLGGYKKISVDQAGGSGYYGVSYLGLNGFTLISEKSFLYGTATRSFNVVNTTAPAGYPKTTFTTIEAGYGYLLDGNTQFTIGYRNQNISDKVSEPIGGIIFGVTYKFN